MTEPVNETPVPFSFFVSLCRELRNIKPQTISAKATTTSTNNTDPKPVKTFRRWVQELHRRFPRPPPETTTILFLFLFPEEDTRRKYGMKEALLAKALVDIFGLTGDRSVAVDRWSSPMSTTPSLGEKICELLSLSSLDSNNTDGPSFQDLNSTLDELASKSNFSASSLRRIIRRPRTRQEILLGVYRELKPFEVAVVTQIILKDLRPILYPVQNVSTHDALLKFNSNTMHVLTLQEAMHVWDASCTLLHCYRVRSTIEDSIQLFEKNHRNDLGPQIGTPVEVPKCVKGYGCRDALMKLRSSASVWAEIKYDGERMQIHVSVDEGGGSKVTIFSKSKRDSTLDRIATHWIIKESLGLQHDHSGKARMSRRRQVVVSSIILEAEMVAYDKDRGIDEYWKIRHLVENTAHGARQRAKSVQKTSDTDASQHLAIVFFDVLYLNGVSLIPEPYTTRRATLEAIIRPIPMFAFIAERREIPLLGGKSFERGLKSLEQSFASSVANHEEGLILKASEATYADWRRSWVKLKRDYIPGLGDTLDLVLIAGCWDKDRGRILRVPTSTYTTFHVAAIDTQTKHSNARPHLEVLFTVSYGLDRKQLEDLNFHIKAVDAKDCNKDDLPYTFNLPPGCTEPRVLLAKPLLVEVFGAGFTKTGETKYYELRFPRISKVHRLNDRSWLEGVTLPEFNEMAHVSVGRNKDECTKPRCDNGVLQASSDNAVTYVEETVPVTQTAWDSDRSSMEMVAMMPPRQADKSTSGHLKRRRPVENDFSVHNAVRSSFRLPMEKSLGDRLEVPLKPLTNCGSLLGDHGSGFANDEFCNMGFEHSTHGKKPSCILFDAPETRHERTWTGAIPDDGRHAFAEFLQSAVILLDCRFTPEDHDAVFIHQFVLPYSVHSREALSLGCGWNRCATGRIYEAVRYGIVIVDAETARLWCNALPLADCSLGTETHRRPIFVFSVDSLRREALEKGRLNEELNIESLSLAVYL